MNRIQRAAGTPGAGGRRGWRLHGQSFVNPATQWPLARLKPVLLKLLPVHDVAQKPNKV